MLLFPKMKKGDQKGDHLRLYFGLNFRVFLEILKNHDFSNQNTASGDPPFPFLENTISQLSQEKNRQKIFKTQVFMLNSVKTLKMSRKRGQSCPDAI